MTTEHIKKALVRVIVFALCFFVGFGISNLAKAQATNEPSLLWKIEGNGIQPSYLFGTFHILPKDDFVLKSKVTEAFGKASQLVMELDMDDPQMPVQMSQHLMMKDGQTLEQLFDANEFNLLDSALQKVMGVGATQVNNMKPFMIYAAMLQMVMGDEPASFEGSLVQLANEGKKGIHGLETVATQMSAIDKLGYVGQAEDLMKMVKNPNEASQLFRDLIDLYTNEDFEGIFELTSVEMDEEGEVNYMLFERNRDWLPKMKAYATRESAFFAVGAAHLGGEFGLINLLKAAGYDLSPVYDSGL